jgi:Ca-activated chloride channel family protein
MSILWPAALVSLAAIPLLIVAYWWLLRRRRRFAVRYASLSLIRAAVPRRSRWRRHLPFALFLAGLSALMVAMSRPQAVVEVPLSRTSIILALDVSRSMCSTDVEPNRLTVAQEAARTFVQEQADGTRIGVVGFAGFAELIVPPTTDTEVLLHAIDNLTTALGTVIGNATLESIDAIAEVNPEVAPSTLDLGAGPGGAPPAGEGYVPDIVVLLTDGANSRGVDPILAAEQAVERRVRVYTIGFGTSEPVAMVCTRQQLGADLFDDQIGGGRFGGGGTGAGAIGGGFRQYLVIDEPTLQTIADRTGGAYYRAEDADQLSEVFAELPTQVELQEEEVEVTVGFAIAGTLLAALAIGLSLAWNRYP